MLIYNEIEKEYLTVTRGRKRPAWAPVDRELITVMGMSGAHLSHSKRQVREISVPVFLMAESFSDLQKLKEDMADWLIHDEPKKLVFKDEPDRTYYAVVDGGLDLDELVRWGEGIINFICLDPYKYGPEKTLTFPADIVKVENEGTAAADPIFEMTATKKATFAMISNGDDETADYNLIGRPAEIDETVVDEKTLLFDETGDTLSDWDSPSGFTGSFKAESNGIFVDSYGTGSDWHGPGLEREIDPTEDFEIEFYTSVRTERPEMTFRLSTNFFDENMNELGLLRVWNKSTNSINKVIEARIGPYTGTKFENYLISSDNYNWMGQRVYNGIVRVTRKGNEYTFYAAHITQRGNHIEPITQRYVDNDNEYAGKLKFIRIDAAVFGSNPSPNELSIRRVRVSRHNKVLVDETPYILFPGDVVTFDHKDDDVLVNGEVRPDLNHTGAFGGSFFKLAKGENMLIVTPEDTFDAQVTFRDKYL